jgi:hypothetical protein
MHAFVPFPATPGSDQTAQQEESTEVCGQGPHEKDREVTFSQPVPRATVGKMGFVILILFRDLKTKLSWDLHGRFS